MHHILVK